MSSHAQHRRSTPARRHPIALATTLGIGMLSVACAQADNARDWQNLPIDTSVAFLYLTVLDSNTSVDQAIAINGVSVNADVWLARYAYSFGVDGRSTGIQILQPYVSGEASLDGIPGKKDNDGMGDTTIVLAHNLFGAPALTQQEFASWQPETFLSGAIFVTAPTGDYNNKKLLNIGTNRWIVKPELAFGTPIGKTWLEANAYASFFQDNDEFLGHHTLKQDPLYATELHYSYSFNPALWASLDASYKWGGESTIAGEEQNNAQDTTMAGASLGFMLSRSVGGMISYMDTVSRPDSAPEANTWTFRMQYAW